MDENKVARTEEQEKNVKKVADIVVDCMEERPEEDCLSALFNSDYFWS